MDPHAPAPPDQDPSNPHDLAVDIQTDLQKLATILAHAGASPQAVQELTHMAEVMGQVVKVLGAAPGPGGPPAPGGAPAGPPAPPPPPPPPPGPPQPQAPPAAQHSDQALHHATKALHSAVQANMAQQKQAP